MAIQNSIQQFHARIFGKTSLATTMKVRGEVEEFKKKLFSKGTSLTSFLMNHKFDPAFVNAALVFDGKKVADIGQSNLFFSDVVNKMSSGQPRYPKGSPKGGQWAKVGGKQQFSGKVSLEEKAKVWENTINNKFLAARDVLNNPPPHVKAPLSYSAAIYNAAQPVPHPSLKSDFDALTQKWHEGGSLLGLSYDVDKGQFVPPKAGQTKYVPATDTVVVAEKNPVKPSETIETHYKLNTPVPQPAISATSSLSFPAKPEFGGKKAEKHAKDLAKIDDHMTQAFAKAKSGDIAGADALMAKVEPPKTFDPKKVAYYNKLKSQVDQAKAESLNKTDPAAAKVIPAAPNTVGGIGTKQTAVSGLKKAPELSNDPNDSKNYVNPSYNPLIQQINNAVADGKPDIVASQYLPPSMTAWKKKAVEAAKHNQELLNSNSKLTESGKKERTNASSEDFVNTALGLDQSAHGLTKTSQLSLPEFQNKYKPGDSAYASVNGQVAALKALAETGDIEAVKNKFATPAVLPWKLQVIAAMEAHKLGNVPTPSGLKAAVDVGFTAAPTKPKPGFKPDVTVKVGETEYGMKTVGGQLGSNPGGQYELDSGIKVYTKFQKSEPHAANETLASNLYALAGTKAPKVFKGESEQGPSTFTVWDHTSSKFDPDNPAHKAAADKEFGTHVWLANHDAIGLSFDNQKITSTGKATTVDVGGSLFFRAQGVKKEFGGDVGKEIAGFTDGSTNPQASKVFGSKINSDQYLSLKRIANLTDDDIKQTVQKTVPNGIVGNGSHKDIADTLIARRNSIAQVVSKLESENPAFVQLGGPKKPAAPVYAPPAVPDFKNPTLKTSAELVHKVVASGSAEAASVLASFKVPDHIMQTVKQENYAEYKSFKNYMTSVKESYAAHKNSAEMPTKQYDIGSVSDLVNAVNGSALSVKPGKHVTAANKLHDYVKLGQVDTLPTKASLLQTHKNYSLNSYSDGFGYTQSSSHTKADNAAAAAVRKSLEAGYKNAASDSAFVSAMQTYKGSGYVSMNTYMRTGEGSPGTAAKVNQLLERFHHHAVELPSDMVVHRGVNLSKTNWPDHIGSVIQEPSFASTSHGSFAAFNSQNTQLRIHLTKGVRGLPAKSSMESDSEREIVLEPGTRYVVVSHEKKGTQDFLDVVALPPSNKVF